MAADSNDMVIRYAEDELDAEQRRLFETRLKTDPALQAELNLYLELRTTLQQRLAPDETGQVLQQRLSTLNKEYFHPQAAVKKLPVIRWAAGIAAAAVLIMAGIFLLRPSDNHSLLDRLGRTEMVTTERGDNTDTLLQAASALFNRGDFTHALPLLDSTIKKDSASLLPRFYRGVAAWHTGATAIARADWLQVYNSPSLLRYEAAFYLALSFSAQKNTVAARQWLDSIPEGTPVSYKANELRTSLK
jgi:hypothetical protein